MQKIFREIAEQYRETESGYQKIRHLHELTKSPLWPDFYELLLLIQGKMAQEMLESRFTKLNQHDKDIAQRTYANIYYVTNLLASPAKMFVPNKWEVHKRMVSAIRKENKKGGRTQKGTTRKEATNDR